MIVYRPLLTTATGILVLFSLLTAACSPQQAVDQSVLRQPPARHLYIVAHQDDDLLFMSPDIQHDIDRQIQVKTVFLTAGDANFQRLPAAREQGILDAYATMALGPDGPERAAWACSYTETGNRYLWQCTLTSKPNVSLVFFRLRDWAPELADLWSGNAAAARVVHADRNSFTGEFYSRDELVATLATLLHDFAPDRLATLDPTPEVYGRDHPEHIAASRFALAAHYFVPAEREVLSFRTYNIHRQQANLKADDQLRAWQALSAYCRASGERCSPIFENYTWRRYASTLLWSAKPVVLRDHLGRCLSDEGMRVVLHSCQERAGDSWFFRADGMIASKDGYCLRRPEAASSFLHLGSCDRGIAQQWQAWSNGQIRNAMGSCLEAAASEEVKLEPCRGENGAPSVTQHWSYQFITESDTQQEAP